MFTQANLELVSALVKFYSKEDIARYMKELVESYQKQVDQHGDKLGSLMRTSAQPAKQEKDDKSKANEGKGKVSSRGWTKLGSMLFNTGEPTSGTTEVIFQIHEEMKQKLVKTAEALKSFEEAAASIIPEKATYLLYLRNGVPERLIVDSLDKRASTFAYEAKFKTV